MGRTFNRPPLTVNTPSSSDVKQYFFNQYNWKGLNDDKNFLTVDQETFSDCNNVYVDADGVLKSRPSLKIKTVKRTNSGIEYTLSNIIDVWTFEFVTIYETLQDGIYYLTFVNSNVENHIQVPLQYVDEQGNSQTYKNIKPIVADEKIFIFAENSFNYYDIKENLYADASEFIHIPVTSVIVDGIVDASAKVESPNVLTTSYITKHLYTSANSVNFNNLVGKQVTVEVDGISYTIDFKYNNQIAFVGRYTGLSQYNFADSNILGLYGAGTPLVQVSEKESLIVCSYSYTINETSKKPVISWSIYHTVDGVIFNKIPEITNVIGMPKISRDGNYCFVFKQDGPYVYSLLDTVSSGKKYTVWTNLLEFINSSQYNSLSLNLNSTNDTGDDFNQSVVVNGYFRDDVVFAFTYGDGLVYSDGDPIYNSLYCVYSRGTGSISRKQIFYSMAGVSYSYTPTVSSKYTDGITFTPTSSGISSITTVATSNNITDKTFNYTRSDGSNITATAKISNIVYTQRSTLSGSILTWGTATLTGNLVITDSEGNTLVNRNISFSKSNYAPVTQVLGNITSYNSWTSNDSWFTYKIESIDDGSETISGITYDKYRQKITITAKSISGSTSATGTKLPVSFGAGEYFARTNNLMPNLYVGYNASNDKISVAIDFAATLIDCAPYAPYYRAIYHIEDGGTQVAEVLNYITYGSWSKCRSPIRDTCIIDGKKYTFVRLAQTDEGQAIVVDTIILSDSSDYVSDATVNKRNVIFVEPYESAGDFHNQTLVLSDPQGYLVTNKYLFDYIDYTNEDTDYTPIPLLFEANPVGHYYAGNEHDCIYVATENALYVSNTNSVITVSELTQGKNNYFLPTYDALLSNYYFSKDNVLYISSPAVLLNVNADKTVTSDRKDFEWYFPELNKQEFDFNITNLHVISDRDVAIFFDHSVSYVNWDNEVSAYRYYKSKLQTGCKTGCDVITSYDGKYIIFTSERGLVAMTYQEFVTTTEQALTYLSDVIYSDFQKYITDKSSSNEVKLFKYAYWIMAYKQDSNKVYLFDIRNNSWWPITELHNVSKLIRYNDTPEMLSNFNMYNFDNKETNYFDYDGKTYKIPWFIKSQKLYLNAVNYYKHIVNITFTSVHDRALLQNANYNVDNLDFKLQVNNYRKKVDGNINNVDDYVTINYVVESARTYVQRLNYSKVNEFQYLLSSNEDNAINIPLSLNSITVKYKIGSQVR